MFPQFGATAESLSKASSLVFRIGTDAHLYDDPDDVSIGPLLDSKYDSEKIEALKRLLALIAQGVDVSNFFPQVVKNVASQPMEIKKLVYLYLLHYAERRPDEALLSINCFQKDLSDPNPLVRAWALRAMAGIRLHAIAPIVSMAVSKCARDPSVYVRKCAANALPKLTDLHQEENASTFEELVGLLLNDQSPGVVGAAAAAFNSVCPHNLPLIGRNFRRLCETLPDVEDWGQIVLIDILLRYVVARHGLVKESVMFSSESPNQYQIEMDFSDDHSKCGRDEKISQAYAYELDASIFISYIEGSEEYLSQGAHIDGNCCMLNSDANIIGQNEDIKLLLQCTSPLLWSQNSAVVLAAAGVHWIMAPRVTVDKIVKPLLFILRSSHTSKYVVLCNIQVFAKAMPHLFAPYYEDFFVCSMEPYPIRTLKLEILSTIATDSSIAYIFQEIQDYVRDPDRRFAADAVAAIGLCAQKIPSVAKTCIEGLLALIKEESSISDCSSAEGEAGILVQAIMSIKAVIKQNPVVYEKLIVQLARQLDTIKEPSARALIVWIVGEYCSIGNIITRAVPVIIKYLAQCFTSEELQTKHQILNTAVKVALSAQGEDALMFPRILQYLLELAKYDINYDVRDRARTMEKLLTFIMTQEGILSPHLHKELSHYIRDHIFRGKIQSTPFCSNSTRAYLPGTLSQVVLHAAPGYERLPKPCSLSESSLTISVNNVNAPNLTKSRTADSGTSESNDSGSLSGSSLDESDSNYNLRRSNSISSDNSERSDSLDVSDNGHTSKSDHHIQNASTSSPLICLSDVIGGDGSTGLDVGDKNATHLSTDLAELMSKSALESWLDDQPELSGPTSSTLSGRQASVRISVKEIAVCVRPTVHNLLQPINGNGLKVNYSFSQQISSISSFLVCVDIFFENTSAESLTNITIKDPEENVESVSQTSQTYESSLAAAEVPRIIPFEEIASLGPGEKMTKVLQIYFHHHLLPHKLVILCNGKKYLVKLQPDIGYFLKPLQLDINAFKEKEKLLPGMFEYNRRCTFSAHDVDKEEHGGHEFVNDDKILMISRRLASRVLSSANVFFVSVDMPVPVKVDDVSGLCLRFSGEILSSSKPCLLTLTADGDCSDPLSLLAKVNCEETIFGLNLLNRVVTFLS